MDAEIDARNPRTAGRELPSGRLLRAQVLGFCAVSLAVLLLAVSQLPEETWVLWPIPVAAFVLYPSPSASRGSATWRSASRSASPRWARGWR